jgi:hypothetical protein
MAQEQNDPEKFAKYLDFKGRGLDCHLWFVRKSDGSFRPDGSDQWYTPEQFREIVDTLKFQPMIMPVQRNEQ